MYGVSSSPRGAYTCGRGVSRPTRGSPMLAGSRRGTLLATAKRELEEEITGPLRSKQSKVIGHGTEVAKVLVSESEKSFVIHRDILTASSDFFKNALDGNFMEKDGVVKLRDIDTASFGVYVTWLYSKKMSTVDDTTETLEASKTPPGTVESTQDRAARYIKSCRDNEWQLLCNCLVLADVLQDNTFHNATMDTFIETIANSKGSFPQEYGATLYTKLPPKSPALLFFYDLWAHVGPTSWISADTGRDWPSEYWGSLVKALLQKEEDRGKGLENAVRPWLASKCRYHKHKESEPKCT